MMTEKLIVIFSILLVSFLVTPSSSFAYPITGNAIKTEKGKIGAGLTPDSWLYGIDVALDNINLALTFDQTEKARKGLNVARERLMEVREMINENRLEAVQTAQREHGNALDVAQNSVKGIERVNSTEEIEEEIEIEKELEEHKTEIETVKGELKVKIEIEGEITPEQQALVDSVLASLEGKVGEVEIEIENEKNKTKIKIEQETGKSSEEVEDEIEELEENKGLKGIRREKAWDKIKDVEEEINKTIEELDELNVTDGNITSVSNALAEAKDAYSTKDFKEAIRLAEQAEDQIEDYKEQFEEIEEEEEREIEVEIKGNQTKVEVEVAGIKAEFILETTDRNEIISEIADRTGLSTSEIENIMELEIEEPEEEIEIEVEIEEGIAKIKTEINETESEFTLNTTNKEEVISEIMSRTGLTREQTEKNAEFKIEEKELKEWEEKELECRTDAECGVGEVCEEGECREVEEEPEERVEVNETEEVELEENETEKE